MLAGGPASAAPTTATLVMGNLTRPAGGVWLQPNSGTGHFWVADNVLGLCEVAPSGTTFATTACQGNAKDGQAVYDSTMQKVYVADNTSKTNQVVRYNYDPVGDRITGSTIIAIPDPAVSQARASAVALMTDPSGVQKLYVGYTRSPAVMALSNPATATATPAAGSVAKVGATSDGRGVDALAAVSFTDPASKLRHDNLYIAEAGGNGMSVIPDIDGSSGRPACTSSCFGTTVRDSTGAVVSFLAGGLVSDGTLLYVGDAPLNGPGKVLRFNPLTGARDVLSDTVPAYTASFDGVTRTTYSNIGGLGIGPNRDIYVGDDPTRALATPVNAQGHLWRVPGTTTPPSITSVSPANGPQAGGSVVTITGTSLSTPVTGTSTVTFGTLPATNVTCDPVGTSCTATSPAVTGAGGIDIRITNGDGQTSPLVAADKFTYDPTPTSPGAPVVTGLAPSSGLTAGGTTVTITGSALRDATGILPSVVFGTVAGTGVTCNADGTICTAISPAGTDGQAVPVQVTHAAGTTAAGTFTYKTPVADLYSAGITAPKGGVTWIPDNSGGHYWVSDHANGFCRLDPTTGPASHAVNFSVCDPGLTIGSPGQAVYDPRANADGTHNVYVPDNATRSPGVWRLIFNPATATVSNPVGMAPGGPLAGSKANGLALDAAADALYVGDLVDGNIRRINGISGDPRLQTVDTVATTQAQNGGATAASRGINGTMALLDGKLYLPENNAATYVDLSQPCAAQGTTTPCSSTVINFVNSATVFVAGVAADPVNHVLYISTSPGGADATIYRWNPASATAANPGGAAGQVYVTGGEAPSAKALGSPPTVLCSITCTRPADASWTPGGLTPFAFASGLFVDPNSGTLYITEDATAGARSGRGNVWEVPYTA
jgi:hypothetical protein